MHMELQWTVWMPWAFWALAPHVRDRPPALRGPGRPFIALQFLSSIYYGVFLATLLGLCRRRAPDPRVDGAQLKQRVVALAIGAVVCLGLVSPYALQYAITKSRTGGRPAEQVLMFSAKPSSYTVATETNFLYGERARARGPRRTAPVSRPVADPAGSCRPAFAKPVRVRRLRILRRLPRHSRCRLACTDSATRSSTITCRSSKGSARLPGSGSTCCSSWPCSRHTDIARSSRPSPAGGNRDPGGLQPACLRRSYLRVCCSSTGWRPLPLAAVSEHRAAAVCVAGAPTARSRRRDAPRSCSHASR